MIAVDTNIISYRWMASAHSAAADDVWRKDPEWIAPVLWRSEFRSVLAGAFRHNLITLSAAAKIMEQAEAEFGGREFNVASGAVLRLAGRSGRSAYDCEFVALAEQQGVPLVTADRQILRAFPEFALSPIDFLRR